MKNTPYSSINKAYVPPNVINSPENITALLQSLNGTVRRDKGYLKGL